MISIFILAAIPFLFWGVLTKEQEEKIKNASWVKCLIYLTLTVVVGVFYIKTYQVTTIKNVIQVDGHRCARDIQTGAIVDSIIDLTIVNQYANSEPNKNVNFSNLSYANFFINNKKGGLYLKHKLQHGPSCRIQEENSHKNNKLSGVAHNYTLTYFASKIPNLSVLQEKFESENTYYYDKDKFRIDYSEFDLSDTTYLHNSNLSEYIGTSGLGGFGDIAMLNVDSTKEYKNTWGHFIRNDNINTFNFFTAADISQCSYIVDVNSICPIKMFGILFNMPVDISPIPYTIDKKSTYGFTISDPETLREIQHSVIAMHVKFPTLANLQLIRSLILTTLLSALLSLFLSNMYFLICRVLRYVKDKYNYTNNPEQQKWRMKTSKIFIVIVCLILLISSYWILLDKYIWIDQTDLMFIRLSVAILFLIALIVIYRFETLALIKILKQKVIRLFKKKRKK